MGGLAESPVSRKTDEHYELLGTEVFSVVFRTGDGAVLGAAFGYAITKGLSGDPYYPVADLPAEEKRALLNKLIYRYRTVGE